MHFAASCSAHKQTQSFSIKVKQALHTAQAFKGGAGTRDTTLCFRCVNRKISAHPDSAKGISRAMMAARGTSGAQGGGGRDQNCNG